MRVRASRLVITCHACGHDVVAVGGEDPSPESGVEASPAAAAASASSPNGAGVSAHGLLELDEDEVRELSGVRLAAAPSADEPAEAPTAIPEPHPATAVPDASSPAGVPGEAIPSTSAKPDTARSLDRRPSPPRDAEVFSIPETPAGGKKALPMVLLGLGVVLAGIAVVILRPSGKAEPDPAAASTRAPITAAAGPLPPTESGAPAGPTPAPSRAPAPKAEATPDTRPADGTEAAPKPSPTAKGSPTAGAVATESEAVASGALDAPALSQVTARLLTRARMCGRLERARDPEARLPGASVVFVVAPSGSISTIRLDRALEGTPLGACLRDELAKTPFPSFQGRPVEIRRTFALESPSTE